MASTETIHIGPQLSRLRRLTGDTPKAEHDEIVQAIRQSLDATLQGKVSSAQVAALLVSMHYLELDKASSVMEACARTMRQNATPVPVSALRGIMGGSPDGKPSLAAGTYEGGFCDLVGTGGDKHNTFNISTTASIICSAFLLMAKHGNRASTSKSGSADLLQAMGASIDAVVPELLPHVYKTTNYAFLFAAVYHPGMAHVTPVRKQLPMRTVFNLLGPLVNPLDSLVEARVIGVARPEIGLTFAGAFAMSRAKKTLVVCGNENLDEISCAGPTNCWLVDGAASTTTTFRLSPEDFGFPPHPLSSVAPGGTPEENAAILRRILDGEMEQDEPIMHFVLINAATLLAMSGCCDEGTEEANARGIPGDVITELGPGGLRLKEGVRRARYAVSSGLAKGEWEAFVAISNCLAGEGPRMDGLAT